ncbi:hypothetical protein ScPMuIL_011164 [Solemya velum]
MMGLVCLCCVALYVAAVCATEQNRVKIEEASGVCRRQTFFDILSIKENEKFKSSDDYDETAIWEREMYKETVELLGDRRRRSSAVCEIPTGTIISTELEINVPTKCSLRCLQMDSCMSFVYIRQQAKCQYYQSNIGPPTDVNHCGEVGYLIYNLGQRKPQGQNMAVSFVNDFTDELTDCDEPQMEAGFLIEDGCVTVGCSRSSSCDKNYVQTGNGTLTCTATGTWATSTKCEDITDFYIGCYRNSVLDRDLKTCKTFKKFNTPRKCIEICMEEGFQFAGLQQTDQCCCGNQYGKHGPLPETDCRSSCPGDADFWCGDYWKQSIYATKHRGPDVFARNPLYIGCYDTKDPHLDGSTRRMKTTNTPDRCISLCRSKGFKFAGLRGSKCLCGNSFGKDRVADETSCSSKCPGDADFWCGGFYTSSIYATVEQVHPREQKSLHNH